MKFTHLQMVQEILSAMKSDQVNSIGDTPESEAVSLLLRSVYYDLAIDLALPSHEGLFELNSSLDIAKPTLMTVPDNVSKIFEIKYNNKLATNTFSTYKVVDFMDFNNFLQMQQGLAGQMSNVGEMSFTSGNGNTFEVMYKSNKMPQWWTSIDNNQVIFDSFYSALDTTLQKSKTMCSGVIYPVYSLTDTFIPDLDPAQFSLLKNRAKVRAFAELKQVANEEAAAVARRHHVLTQERKRILPDYPPPTNLKARFGKKGFINTRIQKSQKQGW